MPDPGPAARASVDAAPGPTPAARALGLALVVLQFALLSLLAWVAVDSRADQPLGLLAPLLLLGAAAVGLAAVAANRPGNFRIRPEPHPQGRLVTHGIYRWVRHPMYAALLLAATGAAASAADGWRLVAWGAVLALLLVLTVKSMLEERWMAERHPDYLDYARRTRRFFPGRF